MARLNFIGVAWREIPACELRHPDEGQKKGLKKNFVHLLIIDYENSKSFPEKNRSIPKR